MDTNKLPNRSEVERINRASQKNIVNHLAAERAMQNPENPDFSNCENDPRARGAESNMDIITSNN